ncbi:hypothetical protein DZF92_07020 [Clavibacter michiganensis subsp. insidiosus]|uniref:Secreted protein n=1 Tax=Clavibacter michiganensis subsp. insidiosus TaxID=33014 RepID=A0A399N041_9MICO|nr:hypothetical protein B5P21_10950 [Clavibacter michiganensis subsp. insidiosus]RII87410.1 hypothetical protein DZF92_07020 [Clavibacter michiganensis subsp. insidiosus]RIJ37167.1 hypothetical protein DZF93_08330 [Clavibacter michiganensis subsp. insidiosus]RMC84885.1 hypothetical protein CmiCFBP2404_09685 [Clavibacter michiganensis subsp. insidiosus]
MHERPRVPLRRRGGAAAASLAVLVPCLLLTGCGAAPAPEPTPAPAPSLTQEQQDDEAFHDVLKRYDELNAATVTDADLTPLLTGSVLESERQSVKESRESGQTVIGLDSISGFSVTDRGVDKSGSQYMTGQFCLDVSGTRIRDANGADVTPERDPRLSLQAKAVKAADGTWRLSDIVRNEDVHACG